MLVYYVRILCLSCSIKKVKTTDKLSKTAEISVVLFVFGLCPLWSLILLPWIVSSVKSYTVTLDCVLCEVLYGYLGLCPLWNLILLPWIVSSVNSYRVTLDCVLCEVLYCYLGLCPLWSLIGLPWIVSSVKSYTVTVAQHESCTRKSLSWSVTV
jgi:hypothetical protein